MSAPAAAAQLPRALKTVATSGVVTGAGSASSVVLQIEYVANVRDALDGIATLATALALQAAHGEIPPAAIDGIGDLVRAQRDELAKIVAEMEAEHASP